VGNVIVVERAPRVLRKTKLQTKFQFPVKPSRGGIFCCLNKGEGKKGGKTEVQAKCWFIYLAKNEGFKFPSLCIVYPF
jgi:hypothetical protein